MKIVLLSDIHLTSKNPRARKDNILLAGKKKLEFVFDYANKIGAHILQAGDVFNSPRDIKSLFTFLSILHKYPKVKFHCVWGQHDMYARNKTVPTNLGILSKARIINILSCVHTMLNDKYVNVIGTSWGEEIIKPITTGINILVIHKNITTKSIWKDHEFIESRKFLKIFKEFDLVLCGDIHRNFIQKSKNKKRFICNTGPMLRLEATQYNMEHNPKFYIYDTEKRTIKSKFIPCEPANEVLSNRHLEILQDCESLSDIYIKINERKSTDIMTIIKKLVIKSKNSKVIQEIIEEISIE